jgi:hypothetical protein
MSVVSRHHHNESWRRLREYINQDDFATAVVVLLFAMAIAAVWFAPASIAH